MFAAFLSSEACTRAEQAAPQITATTVYSTAHWSMSSTSVLRFVSFAMFCQAKHNNRNRFWRTATALRV